jgi:hypothetical protein
VGGACQPCGCNIGDDDDIAPDTINPDNVCQKCNPSRARLEWSPVDNGTACGANGDQQCCGGECCADDECCILDACGTCLCQIGSDNYAADAPNPENPCEVCKPDRDPFDWSTADDDTACGEDRICCAGTCCEAGQCCTAGVCGFCGCRIGDENIAEGTLNPENECEICDPNLDPVAWSPRSDELCSDGQVCCGGVCCPDAECCGLNDVCEACDCIIEDVPHDAGTVNDANSCEICDPTQSTTAWTPLSDDAPCGDGQQVCCGGACCGIGECCTEGGTCLACRCVIEGVPHEAGVTNPDNGCEVCDPIASTTAWSPAVDETVCADDFGQVCCAGECCAERECCIEGACGPCRCTIGEVEYIDGDHNPENDCEVCNPAIDPSGWSLVSDNAPCGDDPDRVCCRGVCCAEDTCCHSLEETCGPEPCHCTIGDAELAEGDVNPEKECEHCDPTEDPGDWTPRSDDSPCGATGDQVCCVGTCCAPGDCCTLGVCGFCGCQIEGESVDEGAVNPANPCQVCDPVQDQFSWSPVADDTSCGLVQVCCNGTCCGLNECCGVGGSCEECIGDCIIGGVSYNAGQENPNNPCEVCDPSRSRTEWSPKPDNSACGENEDQLCCDGVCCNPGWCCIDGRCDIELCNDPCIQDPESCVCEIDGATYPNGTVNPNNECQYCAWHFTSTSWTNVRDDEPCGPSGEQYCCQGVCCAEDQCCTNGGVCATGGSAVCNGCDIEGRFYPIATVNPANQCEFCKPSSSTTSWSPNDNHVPCGDNDERNCCAGICCATGLCCTAQSVGGTCEPCGCEISGGSYVPGATNPANWCQHCDPDISTTSWSTNPDVQFCSFDFSRDCCNGVCCFVGTCCGFSGVCEPMEPDVSNCVNWQFP